MKITLVILSDDTGKDVTIREMAETIWCAKKTY